MNEKEPIRKSIDKLKPYIPGRAAEEVQRELKIPSVVKLASNENPLGPSSLALDIIQRRLKDISIYPDQNSIELKEVLAKRLEVDVSNLIIGNGSDEIMLLAAATFLTAGEEAIISRNTFSTYEFCTRLMDGEPSFVDLKDYTYNLEGFAKAITNKTKLVWLCNPNNPTGTIFTQKQLDSFLNKIPKNAIVVIDEAYNEYVESPEYPTSIKYVKEGQNVIVLRTFSKIYGLAGLRVGYGIAKTGLIKYLSLVKLPFNVNRIAQAAAVAALDDKEHLKKSLKNNQEGKKYLYSELDKMGLNYLKTEANFIWIDVKTSADALFMRMMREGVIVRPLSSFDMLEAIRVTIGTPEQNKRFIEAFKMNL